MATKTYSEKLKDPRWQKKRLEVLSRDNFTCNLCDSKTKTLHVHHKAYVYGKKPWEYELDNFSTLCENCHWFVEQLKNIFKEKLNPIHLKIRTGWKQQKLYYLYTRADDGVAKLWLIEEVEGGFKYYLTFSEDRIDEFSKTFKKLAKRESLKPKELKLL